MTTPLDPTLRDLNDCGCCAGIGPSTPGVVFNRPGLTAIAYRSGTWHEFKESLLAALAGTAHPELNGLATRADDDFSIALLDAVATVGDVLTFYQERIANESYLRTATERVSVLELARLIGYELKPGVAASTLLAFTVDDSVGAPGVATVDIGVKVQSIPGHEEKPQTFETVEKIEVRVEWNAMKPRLTAPQSPASMSTNLYLAGTATDLKVGDVVLLVGPEREASNSDEHWDARRVAQVIPDFDAKRTHVVLGARLGAVDAAVAPSSAPKAYALRTRASVFGYNAPQWRAMSPEFKKNYLDTTGDLTAAQKKEWPGFNVFQGGLLEVISLGISVGVDISVPVLSAPTFDLDSVYPGVLEGSWLVLATPDAVELYSVTDAVTSSRAEFGLSGKTTRLSIAGENRAKFDDAVRTTTVYAQSELLPLAEAPISPAVTGVVSALMLDRNIGALPDGRTLLITGKRASDGADVSESVVLDHVEVANGVSKLVLATALANNYQLGSMTILGTRRTAKPYPKSSAAETRPSGISVSGSGSHHSRSSATPHRRAARHRRLDCASTTCCGRKCRRSTADGPTSVCTSHDSATTERRQHSSATASMARVFPLGRRTFAPLIAREPASAETSAADNSRRCSRVRSASRARSIRSRHRAETTANPASWRARMRRSPCSHSIGSYRSATTRTSRVVTPE